MKTMNAKHQGKQATTQQKRQREFEELTLHELLPYWQSFLWRSGLRPLLHSMLQLDLTLSENLVLRRLQHQPLTVSEVGAYLYITPSAASRAVDRLVRDGLVSRIEDPQDRRQKRLTLTPKGAALVRDWEGKFNAGIEPLVARLSSEEQEQFRLLIAHMVAAQFSDAEEMPDNGVGPQEDCFNNLMH
jgi:DNA-binding MarR family transcriptional regulator